MCLLVSAIFGALLLPASPAAATPAVGRLAGPDRYGTAAAISTLFQPGVPVAFVATGENFPDALAAGPAGVRAQGPVLLVRHDSVPDATRVALDRLDPANIVVLGGAGVVSEGVAAELQPYTSGSVVRVAGADRYETAAGIAANFPPGVQLVYIANGLAFPDALAAGPTAGTYDSPLLLVHPTFIPPSTATQLNRLQPEVIVIAGGPSAVSAAVEQQLAAFAPVIRESGPDRYATSVAISANSFEPGVGTVFLATGGNFPDALAGGPVAGLIQAPVLLVRPDCIPADVMGEINRLVPDDVVLLGGEAVLAPSVAALTVCAAGPAAPPPPPPPPPPPSQAITFSDGTYVVGSQLPASTYRTRVPADGCYWERLSGFSGSFNEIISNNFSNSHQVVTVAPSDAGFSTDGCGVWTDDLSALTSSPTAPFGDGTWIVGTDIAAGTWTAPGGDSCYWERTSGFGGTFDELTANDLGSVNLVVTIEPTDVGFMSEDCGTWTRAG